MGLLRKARQLQQRLGRFASSGVRSCRFEQMEPRRLLAVDVAPIQIGAVYYEDSSGFDEGGDLIEITFTGGADGTQLTELAIDTDKFADGLTLGDVLFDTDPGGIGVYGAFPLEILDHAGIDSVAAVVADGSTQLVFTFTGFDPGERLRFTIDVDEQGFSEPSAVAEGNEFEGSRLKATFAAPHYFDAAGSDIFFDHYDPKLAAAGLDLPPDDYVPPGTIPKPVQTAGAIFAVVQEPLPITISGTVYEDVDLDNRQDAGEPGIEGVRLTLLEFEGSQYVATGQTAQTGPGGDYRFDGVLPGTYRVVETQPDGYFSIGASAGSVSGVQRGVVINSDAIGQIRLVGGEESVDNDFAEARPARLSGNVYHDADNDGRFDAGETGIAGVLLRVYYLPSAGPPPPSVDATTRPDGSWSVDGLMPGDYRVEEVHPDGYLDGLDSAGTAGGAAVNPGDTIRAVHLQSGQSGEQYNFGELIPSSLGGRVLADANGNCRFDPGETLLAGVTVHLLDGQRNRIDTTLTDAAGEYLFTGLPPGVWGVEEITPAGYFDGGDHVGSAGGTLSSPDSIVGVVLASGTDAVRYDFCELLPVTLSGYVYVDGNNDGVRDFGEEGIAGAGLALLDAQGRPNGSKTVTDAAGFYRFDGLAPGVAYGVAETQPHGYFDGLDAAGTAGGAAHNPGDSITDALIAPGTHAKNYNFGELLPVSLSGYVYVDGNNNGVREFGEEGIAGIALALLDAQGRPNGTKTLTDAAGFYRFDGLAPGVAYGVAETQPHGYFDGLDAAGTAGGAAHNPGDSITDATIAPGTHAKNYNFGELLPVSLSGFVYIDGNNNGVREFGEAGIAGVALALLDAQGRPNGTKTLTDAAGFYRFDGLAPAATYGVAESQPDGFLDGLDAAGTAGGAAHNPGDAITGALLKPGTHAKNYNFGELTPASIAGRVWADLNDNCLYDSTEPLLAGVTVLLLDASGDTVASTRTDARGEYLFDDLLPGTYGVEEIQPDGYFDGSDHVGSVGGTLEGPDSIIGITLASGTVAVGYDFCELVPATISGYVFQDGPTIKLAPFEEEPDPATVRDGLFTPDDAPISGVLLTLADASGAPLVDAAGKPVTTRTDARGYYEFTGLEPGSYTVLQTHPQGFTDSIDTAGPAGGIPVNAHEPVDPTVLRQLIVDPNNDAILRIRVGSGDAAGSNNFSEVRFDQTKPYFPPPDPPDPDPVPPIIIPFPGQPSPPATRLLPSATRNLLMPLYGGGGINPNSFTWHLSVVNGGRPRRDGDGDNHVTGVQPDYFNPVSWTGAAVNQSLWVLAGDDGRPTRNFRFGLRGGIPVTGDFDGDGSSEIGVFLDGLWFLDLNGNGIWDEADLWARLGHAGDTPVTGDWDGDGKTDIGIFGPAWANDARAIAADSGLPDADNPPTGRYKNVPPDPEDAPVGWRILKCTSGGSLRTDLIDHVFQYGAEGDVAVAGDWNGDGVANIGLFREGRWYLDADGDGRWSPTDVYVERFGQPGDVPVVGDFNGDGIDQLGVWREGTWHLDSDGDRQLTARDKVFQFGAPGDRPVTGDFNGDGIDEPALYQDDAPATTEAPVSQAPDPGRVDVAARPVE